MKLPHSGGGWAAIAYSLRKARAAGGWWSLYKALRSKNACKTCALGMGGQQGGMVNERGAFPEVCKKSMQAMVADMQGRIAPEFFATYGFPSLRALSPRELESCGRLNEPLYAGPNDAGYHPISWDALLDRAAAALRESQPDQNFFYFSGRASNEAAFLWQLFARLYGTNNVNNCSFYCHQASGVGLRATLGTSTATVTLEDLEHCDTFFLIGGNPASNHPRLMTMLADLRRRGGNVIVINPIRETGLVNFRVPSRPGSLLFGSSIASHYLQPHIGGDIALLIGIAKAILDRGAADEPFIADHTAGFDEFREAARQTAWNHIESQSGVSRSDIEVVASVYAKSRAAIFGWTMGITHHLHGVDNVRAIVNLALLRGMVGRPPAGLLPIRGHSNVQGVGSMGVTPQLAKPILAALEARYGVKLPTTPGLDTLACVDAMQAGRIHNAFCLGGNLFGSNPDATQTAAAFAKLENVFYLSTTLNTGHAWGRAKHTFILPVKARDEESQSTTQESMFNYVRLSDGGPARLPVPRSDVELVADLAERVLGKSTPLDWAALREHRNIREVIAAVVPGYEALGQIDATKKEFQISGRTFSTPHFKTPDARARFSVVRIPDSIATGGIDSAVVSNSAITGFSPGVSPLADRFDSSSGAAPDLQSQPEGLPESSRGQSAAPPPVRAPDRFPDPEWVAEPSVIQPRPLVYNDARRESASLPDRATPGRSPGVMSPSLRLMTLRSEGQFNTVVYEDEDLYRGQNRRDVILMHRDDIARLGLKEDDCVSVTSETGRMDDILVRPFDIRAGNAAMYYPEANVLVPRHADPESRTPAFKNVRITITRTPVMIENASKPGRVPLPMSK